MGYLSITEILQWVHLKNLEQLQNQKLSNLLLFLYFVLCKNSKGPALLLVFLLVEVYGNLSFTINMTQAQYYLGYSFIYSLAYWYTKQNNYNQNTYVGYGLMVLFQAGMAIDSIYNSEIETFIYTNYIYFVVSIHVYIMLSLVEWTRIRSSMVDCARAFCRICCDSDAVKFIWYTANTKQT